MKRTQEFVLDSEDVGSSVESLHKKWSEDPEYQKAYKELGPEFEIARAVILARKGAGLTQQELARRMNTTQSVIARLEGGRTRPSTTTLMSVRRLLVQPLGSALRLDLT